MAKFARLKVYQAMHDTGLVPVFYHADIEIAKQVAAACCKGGARLLEFTNRGDHAIDVFTELEKYCRKELPELILGVGSVVDAYTAAMYIAHGTNFVVGPVLDADTARLCNRQKVAYMPGCGSASEICNAEELGCEVVKVFPGGEVGGPGFVKSVLGPRPKTSIMPTGGVDCTEESLKAWFNAGVVCVGVGSNLITKSVIANGDYASLTAKVSEVLGLISKIKESK